MPKIAIVGAGIAGLNAALTLHDAGISCNVYESSNRLGGRMHSDSKTWADNMTTEWCGEFIDGNHETIRKLAKRFNLPLLDLTQRKPGRNQSLMYFYDKFYSSEQFEKDFETIAPTIYKQSKAVGFPTTYDHFTPEAARLDKMSAYEWVTKYVEGGHTTPLGRMFAAGCTGFYGLDSSEQSALNLIYMYAAQSQSEEITTSAPMQGSSKIAGGNQRLPEAIADSLPEGTIHLSHRLTKIRRADETIILTFSTENGLLDVHCEEAILALPFSTLRLVDYQEASFDSLKRTAIEQLGYGTISKLFLQFDTPYWYQPNSWPPLSGSFVITDLSIQTVWDTSLGQSGTTGLLVDYTSGHRGAAFTPKTAYSSMNDEDDIQYYVKDCLQQLERVFPGISAHYIGRAALSYPTGDPNLLGSYSCWRVGQYTSIAGYERVAQGPIHFAGEHCSTNFQGYMEGGAEEGERAANEVIKNLR